MNDGQNKKESDRSYSEELSSLQRAFDGVDELMRKRGLVWPRMALDAARLRVSLGVHEVDLRSAAYLPRALFDPMASATPLERLSPEALEALRLLNDVGAPPWSIGIVAEEAMRRKGEERPLELVAITLAEYLRMALERLSESSWPSAD